MKKLKNSIIPFGNLDEVNKKEQKEHIKEQEESFFSDPLIPWWFKVAYVFSPVPLHKPDRAATWCKICLRKHSKRLPCESLRLIEDLTVPPTKTNKDGDLIENRKIGFYTTQPKEALAT